MATPGLSPEEAARGILRERYERARVMSGEVTPASDLDIVMVYEWLANACREAFVHDAGLPTANSR